MKSGFMFVASEGSISPFRTGSVLAMAPIMISVRYLVHLRC